MFVRLAAALNLEEELGRAEWTRNEGRVRDRDRLEDLLAARLAELALDEVVERLQAHRVLVARVRRADEAARGEQAEAMGMVYEDDGVLIARSASARTELCRSGRHRVSASTTRIFWARFSARRPARRGSRSARPAPRRSPPPPR
ncbi:CoA transferase [Microbacterium sp. NIBRBAC000506063]|uniref:CoA transferase n=1 Tax=Microbacterium sp. NIBRBAC000506063 TaxID=2734618 RepID=UPI00397F4AA8